MAEHPKFLQSPREWKTFDIYQAEVRHLSHAYILLIRLSEVVIPKNDIQIWCKQLISDQG